MRIVIEPGSYTLENVGDVAMLQVAARRLREQWPDATITVVTEAPEQLPSLCPGTEPVLTREQSQSRDRRTAAPTPRLLSWNVWQRLRSRKPATPLSSQHSIDGLLREADLLVVSGMGGLNDAFAKRASRLLSTVELAGEHGVPVALLGQGIGPAREPAFRERLATALSHADLIALRERVSGPALLDEIGVPRHIVRVTGDDAIEPAYQARPERLGTCLGVNVRVAEYAGVDDGTVDALRGVLRGAGERLGIRVVPVPISHRHGGLDANTNRALLREIDPDTDGGAALRTPEAVMEQVGRCRLVVTGSYHGGVFALAQGIPVIGLVNSAYYADKFLGLADMFGSGCEVVSLGDREFPGALAAAIDRGWASAGYARPALLAAAAQQIELGYDAYRELRLLARRTALDTHRQTQPAT